MQAIAYIHCPACGKMRWIIVVRGCHEHRVEGRRITIRIDKDSPYHLMVRKNGFIGRSRLIMAESLGRCLTKKELVHHIDNNTLNDDITNLQLMSGFLHSQHHGTLRFWWRGGGRPSASV